MTAVTARQATGTATLGTTPDCDRWDLWGTYAYLAVTDTGALPTARRLADDLLGRIGAACSRFRPDSDLTVANRHAGTWVEADPLLVAAVRAALWAAQVTHGAVDPCLGRALVSLGYDDDLSSVRLRDRTPPLAGLDPVAAPGAWREVRVADDAVRVPSGAALDLGATAKAWAADVVAQSVADALGCGTVVSLGGDVRVAGPVGGPSPTWPVRVGEDHRDLDHAGAGEVVRVSGGLATSTTVVRRWQAGRVERHHLLDPRTGLPAAAPYRTVTAGGRTCLAANAASTAAVVLGERAPGWLADNGVTARLVARDGTVTRLGSWPADAGEDLS